MPIGGAGVRCGGWCQDCDHHKVITIDGHHASVQRSNICAHDPYLAGSPENR